MHYYLRLLLYTALLSTVCIVGNAQRQTILLLVKDSTQSKPLQRATAVLLSRKDSAYIEFGITDSLGKYLFKNVNLNTTGSIVISMAGYTDQQLLLLMPAIKGKSKQADTTIEVKLATKFIALQDVVVNSKANPIRMNKDTLEFDADFFKSQPNAMLEDLLRKLPGVEIRNGNEVYVNGQRVSRMLVDGKEFFSADPVIILNNLPAEIIAKVQVADDRKTIAKETRLQKDIPKTINLKLKKEVRKGMFGKFFAGGGTDSRYETGGILNTFRDTLQVSLIGSSNNQGSGGFTSQDLNDLGGFERSEGLGSQSAGDISNRYREGIETRHLAGINANYNKGTDVQLNAQYFYNGARRREVSQILYQQLLADTALLSNTDRQALFYERTHKVSAGFRWKQDSTGYLTVQLNTEFGNNWDEGTANTQRYSQNVPLLSQSATISNDHSNLVNLGLNTDYSKTFVKRHLDWYVNVIFSNNTANEYFLTNNRYSRIVNNFLPDSLQQERNNRNPDRSLYLENKLTKTWKDRHSLIWRTEYTNSRKKTGGDTYQYSEVSGRNELIPSLSIQLRQQLNWVNNQLYYRYSYKDFSIQPGISIRNLLLNYSYDGDSIPSIQRNYLLFTPTISINYKGFSFDYDRHQPEPSIWDLRPVTDSSNPLYVMVGNPNLQAPINSSYTLGYYKYLNHAHINLNFRSSIRRQQDAIISYRQVSADGKTITGRTNFDETLNYDNWFNVNKSFVKRDWNYNLSINASIRFTQSPLLLNGSIANTFTSSVSPFFQGFAAYKDIYRWRVAYSVYFNRTRSDDKTVQTANTVQYNLANTFYVKLHRRLWWDARLSYTVNPGIQSGFQKQWVFCDMSFTGTFMKNDRAQLKISAYDLFNQNQGISRGTWQNTITDYKALVQRRYFMLTFLYTLRNLQ